MEKMEAEKLIWLTRQVSEIFSSPGDLEKALEATLEMVRTVLEAEACSIMLLEPQSDELHMAVSTDIEREMWPKIKARIGEGYAGRVAQSGRPILVSDVHGSEHPDEERRRRYKSGSFVCVPVKTKGETIGVLNLTNRKGGQAFSPGQLDIVALLANLVALAIENTRLVASMEIMSRRLRDVLEGIGDGVIAVDPDGNIILFNEIALRYLGEERERCIGRRLPDVVPASLRPVFQELHERTLTERSHIHEEIEWAGRDLTTPIPVTLSTTPLYHDTRGHLSGVVFVIHDMTLHHKLYELKRIEEAKNNFLAIISHELRTPLTSIRGAMYLLRGRLQGRLESETLELFRIVEQNSERLLQQIINLLDVVDIENETVSLTLRPTQLCSVATRSVARVREAAERKQIELTEDYENDPGPLCLDEEKTQRAIDHLLDNAVKFTPRFGRITVATGRSDTDAYLAVRDSGTGIDPTLRDRIFGKFVQGENHLRRQWGGCGIGLFVARAFAELQEGRIETTNFESGGCEFRLVFQPAKLQETYDRQKMTATRSKEAVGP